MKDRILKQLIANKGEFVSGQHLSEKIGTSRTAVWKHIKTLKVDGYQIESVPNKGYKLIKSPDLLSQEELSPLLQTNFIGKKIIYKDKVNSTSNLAKEIALSLDEGTVIIAEEQTKGRGRMGRHWVSLPRTGIWMSIILKPNIRPDKAYQITQTAAVAIVKAIEKITGLSAGIKWPNDIIINGKKVCGILTEMSAEPDRINYIILGIGINVNTSIEDIPEYLRDKATSLKAELGKEVSRKELVAAIFKNIEKEYYGFVQNDFRAVIDDCRKYSVLLGKEITITQMDKTYKGRAIDIREDGVLLIRTPEGMIEAISGDVSIRGQKNEYL